MSEPRACGSNHPSGPASGSPSGRAAPASETRAVLSPATDAQAVLGAVPLGADRSLASRISWNAAASAIASAGRLLTTMILARLLGPENMGQFTFATWLVEVGVLVVSLGVPSAVIRYVAVTSAGGARAGLTPLLRPLALWGFASTGIGSGLVFALGLIWVFPKSGWPLSAALALVLCCQLWAGVAQAVLVGLQRFKSLAAVATCGALSSLAAAGIGSAVWGAAGAIVGTGFGFAVSAAVAARLVQDALGQGTSRESATVGSSRGFWGYALNTWGAAVISAVVWGRTELFFLERLAGRVQVAYFGVGLVFSSVTVQLIQLFTGGLMPHFASLVGRGEAKIIERDYERLTTLAAGVSFPTSFFAIALMPELLAVIFGASYTEAVAAGRWLAASGLWMFATVGSATVYGLGDAALIRRWSLLGAFLMIVGCYVLVPGYGAAGAAAARFAVQGIMVTVGSLILQYRYGLPFPIRRLTRFLGAAAVGGLLARTAATVAGGGLSGLAAGMMVGGLAYLVALRLMRVVDADLGAALVGAAQRAPRPLGRLCRTLIELLAPARR
jgi:O-antigen/teichoic acid export membrane protein